MKILSLILSFCISFNVLAQTASTIELEEALNEYQYSLSVEWDQKDEAFHDKETEKFFEKLSTLMIEKGLSKNEVLAFAESKVKNKESLSSLKLGLALQPETASSKEIIEILKSNSDAFYSKGASWNGLSRVEVWGLYAVLAIIVHGVWFQATHECVEWKKEDFVTCSSELYQGEHGFFYGGEKCERESYCVEYVKKQ